MKSTIRTKTIDNIIIIAENRYEEMYIIESAYIQDILDNWKSLVPSKNTRVFFASWNGRPINPYEYRDFESLIAYLSNLQKR